MVVFERGRAGVAAAALARLLADEDDAAVTVVSVVPTASACPRCVGSSVALNAAIAEAAEQELAQARAILAGVERTSFAVLPDATLPQFAAAERFRLVLLPARRRLLRRSRHPAAKALRRAGADVWVVDPPSRRSRPPAG